MSKKRKTSKQQLARRSPAASALREGQFKHKIVPDKKKRAVKRAARGKPSSDEGGFSRLGK